MYAEIRKWENNPTIRCNNVMRLLKLYIGMGIDHLMDKDGRIHCKDFNKVANILHSRNPRTMIDTVVNSESFVCEKCNSANTNIYGIMWFASPLFATGSASVQSSPTSDKSSPTSDLNSPTSDLNSPTRDSVVGEFHLLNKYIKDFSNIPSGGIACAHASDSSGVAPTVRKLMDNPDIMRKMFNAVIQVVEKCVERHGEKFLSTSEEGQEAWASNIIGSKHCANVIAKKTGEAIKSLEAESFAPAKLEHPHGEHEFSYPGYPQRYYDYEGYAMPIPAEAPDRPSPTATWNKFMRQWREVEN